MFKKYCSWHFLSFFFVFFKEELSSFYRDSQFVAVIYGRKFNAIYGLRPRNSTLLFLKIKTTRIFKQIVCFGRHLWVKSLFFNFHCKSNVKFVFILKPLRAFSIFANKICPARTVNVIKKLSRLKSTGRYWMDEVFCDGTESELSKCRFEGWGRTDCRGDEAAGVICGQPTTYRNSTFNLVDEYRKTRIGDTHRRGIGLRLSGGRQGRVELKLGGGSGAYTRRSISHRGLQ